MATRVTNMLTRPRVLFVDDEPTIRLTLSSILEQQGFQVTVASTVAEALALITAEHYDALISDLNIGQPGDGFTVVSAMRRVQPEAVTLILTGYPAFEAALRAIREQVDDFLVKPAEVTHLVAVIRERLGSRDQPRSLSTQRLWKIIADHRDQIIADWLGAVEQIPEIARAPLSREERINDLPKVIDELTRVPDEFEDEPTLQALSSAARHGALRAQQGYSMLMVLEEARVLQLVLADHIRRNLLTIDISLLIPDLMAITDRVHRLLRESVAGFLATKAEPTRAA